MAIHFDWKFWVVLAATLAGVLVPVWLWRVDLEARSVHFRKLSQTSLQPPDAAKTLDLRVTLGGSELQSPYLTVFELVNDGARPVPASDFESALEITPKNKAEIVRTSITAVRPADLAPSLSLEGGTLKIKPMLLNPGDSVTIAILTIKEEPDFVSRARIAGVRTVPIVNLQAKAVSPVRMVVLIFVGFIFFVVANLVVTGWPSRGVRLRPRASFLMFVAAMIGATIFLTAGLEYLGIEGFWQYAGAFVAFMLLTNLISSWLNRAELTNVRQKSDAV